VIRNNGYFGRKRLYRLEQLFGLFPRLRCAIAFGQQGDSVDLEAVLFEVMPVYKLVNLIQGAKSLVAAEYHQLRPASMTSSELFKTLHLDFARISFPPQYPPIDFAVVRPVCDNLNVTSNIGKPMTEVLANMGQSITELSADMAKITQLAQFYSLTSKKRMANLNISYSHFFFVEHITMFVSAICLEIETSF
jgi:hypothetical protein